ncbi:MAG: hypothetical protein IPM29_07945 [Planctomycetes bacterium]|nr:hypothetical protein [Planctomycetota bacterium]
MKLEDLATPPPRVSPQMRYATLHRAVENGLATDRTWAELLEICLELGRDEEACGTFWELRDPSVRRRMLVRLHTRGLLRDVPVDPAPARQADAHATAGEAAHGGPAGRASAASGQRSRPEDGRSDLGELVGDAVRFLFLDHMPLTVIVATVTFPLVIGLGGFLTTSLGTSAYVALSLLAAIPALSALALVGALARRILIEANRGLIDPPAIPTFGSLAREALRLGVDTTLLVAVFLGPGVLLAQLGVTHVGAAIAALAVGGGLLPAAVAMRTVRGDWSALKLARLCGEVRRIGSRYFGVAAIIALMLAPAIAGLVLTAGSAAYMSISVVGPLTVAPLFVSARLLGHVMFESRRGHRRLQTAGGTATRRGTGARSRLANAQAQALRQGLRATAHPEARTSAPPRQQPVAQPVAQPGAAARPTARPRAVAPSQPVAAAQPAVRTERAQPAQRPSGRLTTAVTTDSLTDLTRLPGASVVTGTERERAGAASRRRR